MNVPPRLSLAGGVAEHVRRSDVQDSTHAVGVPVVALTADERGALRNHIAETLLLAGGDLEHAYVAVELARPEAVDRVSKALVDVRLATDVLERDFGWDPTVGVFLQLDEAGCELLDRAVAQARGCLPPSEQDHPDDVRGWVALVALGDRVAVAREDLVTQRSGRSAVTIA